MPRKRQRTALATFRRTKTAARRESARALGMCVYLCSREATAGNTTCAECRAKYAAKRTKAG